MRYILFLFLMLSKDSYSQLLSYSLNKSSRDVNKEIRLSNYDTLEGVKSLMYRVTFIAKTKKRGKIPAAIYCKFAKGINRKEIKSRSYKKCFEVVPCDTLKIVRVEKVGITEYEYFTKN